MNGPEGGRQIVENSREPLGPVRTRQALLVLGMHRSGTSALTRCLSLLGVSLPGNIMGPAPSNESGHWESLDIVQLHTQLLTASGSSWDDWSALPADLSERPGVAHRLKLLSALLSREFAEKPFLAIKDPRVCRLFPLWRALLAQVEVALLPVLIVRHPLEVAASLATRDGFGTAKSCLLWLRHVLSAEAETRDIRRAIVTYEDLLREPRAVLERVETRLGISWPRATSEALAEIEEFLRPEQRHHFAGPNSLRANPDVPDWIEECYAAMLALAHDGNVSAAWAKLDTVRLEFEAAAGTFAPVFREVRQTFKKEVKAIPADRTAESKAVQTKLVSEAKETDPLGMMSARLITLEERAVALESQLRAVRAQIILETAEGQALQGENRALISDVLDLRADMAARLESADRFYVQVQKAWEGRTQDIAALELQLLRQVNRTNVLRGVVNSSTLGTFRRLGQMGRAALQTVSQMAGRSKKLINSLDQKVIRDSGLFDPGYYLSQVEIWPVNSGDPLIHYLEHGEKAGLKPHALFEPSFYRGETRDFDEGAGSVLAHYLRLGWKERLPNPWFDSGWYCATYPDVTQHGMNPLLHYMVQGFKEGRQPGPKFNPVWYRTQHPLLAGEDIDPLAFHLDVGRFIGFRTHPRQKNKRSVLPKKTGTVFSPLKPEVAYASAALNYSPVPPPSGESIGYIEAFENGVLSGWAGEVRAAGELLDVEVFANNVFYKKVRADRDRPDIAALEPDLAARGFSTPIDLGDFDASVVHFSARVRGSRRWLRSKVKAVPLPHRDAAPAPVPAERLGSRKVTVIIPIYNAPTETKACVESVLENLPPWAELLICDDASPDPSIPAILSEYEGLPGVTIVRHPKNLGYTGNINTAVGLVPDGDVVLLNSDTLVSPEWLRLLQRAAYRDARTGTVTALSDNAGAFSAPVPGEPNELPAWHDRDSYARTVAQGSRRVYPVVPTGSGFCLYIRRDLLNEIGLFDADTFPRGYGEENDFCMRAQRAGWKNLVCDQVYVRHARSASFGESKDPLMARAAELIAARYPDYPAAVRAAFTNDNTFNGARYRIGDATLRRPDRARPRILFVIGVETGGTPQTNLDLMSSIQSEFEPLLFLSNLRQLRLFRIRGKTHDLLEEIDLIDPIKPSTHDSVDYAGHVSRILDDHAIELVHIRHLGRHGVSLVEEAEARGIPVVHSFHDFYTVCPNVKLIDAIGQHCGGTCTTGRMPDCSVELWSSKSVTPPLKHAWIHDWQALMRATLAKADAFVTTSDSAKRLVLSNYPELASKPFAVVPHGRDFNGFAALAAEPSAGERLRILVPGILTSAKGLDLIRAVKALDREDRLEFHFLGREITPLAGLGVSHGAYERDRFSEHIEKIQPHVGAVLSIWPETYSHTLTEMWSCGIPVVVTSFGAPPERVAEHGGGWILEDCTPETVYAELLAIATDEDGIREKTRQVLAWQAGYGDAYRVEAMSLHYRQLYRSLLSRRNRLGSRRAPPRLVYAATSHAGRAALGLMGVDHMPGYLGDALGSNRIVVEPISHRSLRCLEHLPRPDAVLIRCDGTGSLGAEILDRLIRPAAGPGDAGAPGRGWKLVVEILGETGSPPELTEDERALVAAADLVVTLGAPDRQTPAEAADAAAQLSAAAFVATAVAAEAEESVLRAAKAANPLLAGSKIGSHNKPFVVAHQALIDWQRLHALAGARARDRVSIVIPVFNLLGMTQKCLASLVEHTSYPDYEIVVVDNGSKAEISADLEKTVAAIPNAVFVKNPNNLMFAMGCNVGGAVSTGEYILFLNNDVEATGADWLTRLIEPLKRDPAIGIVGGKLLYADATVQHAGIVFGEASKFPYHIYKGFPPSHPAVNKSRVYRAVTGACLGIRAGDFAKLRGFDATFVNGSEDVDLCFRMEAALKRACLYVPSAILVHHEGRSPGRGKFTLQNRRAFVERWRHSIAADDHAYFAADDIVSEGYEQVDRTEDAELSIIRPLISAGKAADPAAAPQQHPR